MTLNEPEFVMSVVVTAALDVLFGVVFNKYVAQHQALNGGVYTAIYVVAGVLVTLVSAAWLIGVHAALVVAVLFAASGAPMVIGSMHRHTARIQATNDDAIRQAQELLHDAQSEV